MKFLKIERCSRCPFNEHGQETSRNSDKEILQKMHFGMPLLYCMYNPEDSPRSNGRSIQRRRGNYQKDNGCRIIWISDDPEYQGEFDKQIHGFPDWCPLEDKK